VVSLCLLRLPVDSIFWERLFVGCSSFETDCNVLHEGCVNGCYGFVVERVVVHHCVVRRG